MKLSKDNKFLVDTRGSIQQHQETDYFVTREGVIIDTPSRVSYISVDHARPVGTLSDED